MGKIVNPTEQIILKKGFGIWPKDVINPQEQNDTLIKALNIEYRFQEYLSVNKLDGLIPLQNPDSTINLFIEESKQLLKLESLQPITKFITLINVGHFKFIQNEIQDAITILSASNLEFNVNSNNYVQSLFYRKHFLLASSYHTLRDLEHEKEWLITGVNFFHKIPTLSNIESFKWLNLIYEKLLGFISAPVTISQLDSIFKHKNHIISFIDYSVDQGIKYDAKDLQNFAKSRSQELLSTTKFPKSDEVNNYELEEFLSQVNDCKLVDPKLSSELLERGINRTYQSHILLRSLTKNLLLLSKRDEAYHSFEVYMDYIESYYVQNNHSFNDILGILSTFKLILNDRFSNCDVSDVNVQDYDRYIKIVIKFEELLDAFYQDNELLKVDQDVDLLDDERLLNVNNEKLKLFLSEIWYTLAISNIKLYKSSQSLFPEHYTKLTKSISFFKNAIYNDSNNDEVLFQYVKFMATLRKIKESYKVLKKFLTKQTIKNTTFFKSWHLLVLIVSIEENQDEAYKIINFLVNEVTDFIELSTDLSLELKECFIQIKITQLAIIESLYGIEQCLDSLTELFGLYNQLFKDTLQSNEASSANQPSKQLHRTSTMSKIKSIRSHKEKPVNNTTSKPKVNINFNQTQILQKIWLITSTIYYKANLIEDSEQAIVEAEKLHKPTPESCSILGMITSESRPDFALKEFEKALGMDGDYSMAIIGFANLVLSNDCYKNSKVFINEKDFNAAIARVKILLELSVENFDSSMISEIWFLLSKIYEKYGDKKRYRESLWKSIELEETRPIRDFNNV